MIGDFFNLGICCLAFDFLGMVNYVMYLWVEYHHIAELMSSLIIVLLKLIINVLY